MNPRRWESIQAAFDELVSLNEGGRATRLALLGASDPELRAAVESLLVADAEADARLAALEAPFLSSAPLPDLLGLAGRTVSHFRVLEPLGAGGMGVVYRAEDTRLGRAVALKFLHPHFALDDSAKKRFFREARSAAALDHPNLCTIYEVGESDDGRLFLAMALYSGKTLKAWLEQDGPLPWSDAVEIARQIAQGLGCAHAAGIVHRDLKPGNVMVQPDGTVKILDFGLARSRDEGHSGASAGWGTAAYMSPEQVRGHAVDARADLWALGVVLYEMVTGRRPFGEGHDTSVAHAILEEDPDRPSKLRAEVPAQLEGVILTLLEKESARRFASAGALDDALTSPHWTGMRPRWPRARRRWLIGFAASASILAALGLGAVVQHHRATASTFGRIAVLPLANLTGDTAQEYLVDGMHDALVTELAKIGALSVISRNSVLRYRNSAKSVSEIARELQVDAVVEGSVVLAGDSVRINAQLIEGTTDKHLWADSFVKSRRSVLALYGDVARGIAREVRAAVTPEERARLTNTRLVDPQANDLFVRGRYYCEQWTEDGFNRGIAFLRRAIDQDPTFALAYAWLSTCYAAQTMSEGAPPDQNNPLAKATALRALELDSTLGMPYVTLGWIRLITDLDFDGPERDFRRALELSPGSSEIHAWHADYLKAAGRFDEALREYRLAVDLNPLDASLRLGLGDFYFFTHRYDESITQLRRTLAQQPGFPSALDLLSLAYSQKGMHEAALALCDSAMAVAPHAYPNGSCGSVYARAGRRQQALEMIQRMTVPSHRGGPDFLGACIVYAALGDRDSAMEWLHRAVRGRFQSQYLVLLKVYPMFDPLRGDPRFQALLRELRIQS